MLFKKQATIDAKREAYDVTFPADLSAEAVQAWLRSITGTMHHGGAFNFTRDAIVFEVASDGMGIKHRLLVPSSGAEYITAQLRSHASGIVLGKSSSVDSYQWKAAVEIGMGHPLNQLSTDHLDDLAGSVLGSMNALQAGESILLQWVISPAPFEPPPPRASSSNVNGSARVNTDFNADRRKKLNGHNFLAVGRLLASADSSPRAWQLIGQVKASLTSANSALNYLTFKDRRRAAEEASEARTPFTFPAQLTVAELSGLIAWPFGTRFIPGLVRSSSRQLFATSDVASEGRVLGISTYSGHERPVALPYKYATRHMMVTGGSGAGKTAFLVNCFAQDVEKGYGAIVMDAGDSESDETMFSGAIRSIPPERADDVIVIDIANEGSSPVGFNIFEQADPRTIADQIVHLFQGLYSDISGVWLPQLLYHGVYTLAEHGGLSFVDLGTLLNPQTAEEKIWAQHVIGSVKDQNIREWWDRWQALDTSKQQTRLEPLYNRIWQISSRPEIINVIGQSISTFHIKDALESNKIILINLARLSSDTAKIIGTLFMNAVWTAARRSQPPVPNYMYLDEFQVMTSNTSVNLDDLLSRARKHNLGLAMATQYFEEKVPRLVQRAAMNNALTKVVFRVATDEARKWNAEFSRDLDNHDFTNLNDYEAFVRIASETGVSDVSIATLPPRKPSGAEALIRDRSRMRYGRPLEEVLTERQRRRSVPEGSVAKKKRPPIGIEEW